MKAFGPDLDNKVNGRAYFILAVKRSNGDRIMNFSNNFESMVCETICIQRYLKRKNRNKYEFDISLNRGQGFW